VVQPLERIAIDPEQCGGRPCIHGMRILATDVPRMLAAVETIADILADYPYLEQEDITACLKYAGASLI
jgi:uncharacterized protein (DUF433 family)